MTLSEFRFYEEEVVDYVNKLLDEVKECSFSDYVLLLSRASYQKENEGTFLSPYVVQSNLEIIQDQSRQNFLHTYLNHFTALMEEGAFMTDVIQEFNWNLQLMMYSHVWESHRFLMNLKRIASILSGKGYAWKIPFERTQKKGASKMIPINKGKFIKEEILDPFSKYAGGFATFLDVMYDSTIRNGYAHSSYLIDMQSGSIEFLKAETYMIEKVISALDWEQKFCYTVLFSYHLTKAIMERLNSFMDDYPDTEEVEIMWPSFKQPGKSYRTGVYPVKVEYNGQHFVEFNFAANKKLL